MTTVDQTTANLLAADMTISHDGEVYVVVSNTKVTLPATPKSGAVPTHYRVKLRHVSDGKEIEKTFKPQQKVEKVAPEMRELAFLYVEGKDYLFIDKKSPENVILIPKEKVGEKAKFLREAVDVTAKFYKDEIYEIDLPTYLELKVTRVEDSASASQMANSAQPVILETGAMIEVPTFVSVGDVIKVETKTETFIQRV